MFGCTTRVPCKICHCNKELNAPQSVDMILTKHCCDVVGTNDCQINMSYKFALLVTLNRLSYKMQLQNAGLGLALISSLG